MSRTRTLTRLRVLESQAVAGFSREMLSRLAQRCDLDEVELIAEAQRLANLFQREGLVTWDQQRAHVAWEMGVSVEELQLEIDELLAVSQ